jgi:hypothetical protein
MFFNTFLTLFTNACESFHHNFNDSMYKPHPNLFVFLEKLKEFQRRSETDTMIKRHNNKNIIIMSGWRRDSFK